MRGCRYRMRRAWDPDLPARHFGGPRLPPPPPPPEPIELPPMEMPGFHFEMPELPKAPNLEEAETKRKLEAARESERVQSLKLRGHSSTILNRGGAAGLSEEPEIRRPGLLAR